MKIEDLNRFNPYKILNVTEETLKNHKDNLEEYLLQKKEELLKLGVNTKELDQAYNILLDENRKKDFLETRERLQVKSNVYLNKAYNFRSKFDETLIKETKYVDSTAKHLEVLLEDGTTLKLKETGEILYKNCMGLQSKMSEFELTKIRNGLNIINKKKVYSNISLAELKQNNSEYQYYTLFHLLSDERAKACIEFNHGYLGELERDEETGLYYIKVNPESFSAVMKFYGEKNKKISDDKEKNQYIPRHAKRKNENIVRLGDLSYLNNNPKHAKEDISDDDFER